MQGFHFSKSQCTVHPFVIHSKDDENNEKNHQSFCFLSPNINHNTIMVYTFLKILISYIKIAKPHVKKIHYFTDGCAAQYKKRYNFINICKHMDDFCLECE